MKHLLILLFASFYDIEASVRGYSTVWRNSQNKIVKKVVYTSSTRLKNRFETELDEFRNLEHGWEYLAHEIRGQDKHNLKKILVKKIKKLDPVNVE